MDEAKKILSQMDEKQKFQALNGLLKAFETPHILMVDLGNDLCGISCSETIGHWKFLEMMSCLIVGMAERNNMTPIKMLANLGEAVSETVSKDEKYKRTKKNNKVRAEAAESKKRS